MHVVTVVDLVYILLDYKSGKRDRYVLYCHLASCTCILPTTSPVSPPNSFSAILPC